MSDIGKKFIHLRYLAILALFKSPAPSKIGCWSSTVHLLPSARSSVFDALQINV